MASIETVILKGDKRDLTEINKDLWSNKLVDIAATYSFRDHDSL